MDPEISIRIARASALLAFSSAVGWVSGVRFDGEPPRVSVCISEAVRPRNEVLPQGNADVPSRTTAGGFSFLLDLHSHFPRLEFQFENRAFSLHVVSGFASACSVARFRYSSHSAHVRDRGCIQIFWVDCFSASREATVILTCCGSFRLAIFSR